MNFFEVENSTVTFGGLTANNCVNIEMDKGEIVGLIGPNGSGKSTLFKSISGFNKINSGQIRFEGKGISNLEPNHICRAGIACTFQKAQSFAGMTLEESVLVGAYCRHKLKKNALEYARKMIVFMGLDGKEKVKISKLNMYDRKKAELAAALATQPQMLLLDELFAGLVPTEVEKMIIFVKRINEELGISLFIVEHVLKVIMSICDRVYVLESGKIIASGTPGAVSANPQVIKAYLGDDYSAATG